MSGVGRYAYGRLTEGAKQASSDEGKGRPAGQGVHTRGQQATLSKSTKNATQGRATTGKEEVISPADESSSGLPRHLTDKEGEEGGRNKNRNTA